MVDTITQQPIVRQPVFDPSRYLTKVSGNDYLEVKFRIQWFRSLYPEGQIETELVRLENKETVDRNGHIRTTPISIFRAVVSTGNGGVASGYGSETESDFKDHIEKSESKAVGRALAALGFGTQFAGNEWSGEGSADRPVDNPVGQAQYNPPSAPPQPLNYAPQSQPPQQQSYAPQQSNGQQQQQQARPTIQNPDAEATPAQHQFLQKLCLEKNFNYDELAYLNNFPALTRGEASRWIDSLKTGYLPEGAMLPN